MNIYIDDLIDYNDDVITNKQLHNVDTYKLAKSILYRHISFMKVCPKKHRKCHHLFIIQYLLYVIRNKKHQLLITKNY